MKKIKAIIVDDEPKSRKVLAELVGLFCKNIELIDEAGNIADAINKINSLKPDLVFFDILLQEGDSFEIIQNVDKVDFEMIFVTAFDEDTVKALKFSGARVLLKPIQINELIEAVNDVSTEGQSLLSYQMADGVLKSQFTQLPVITSTGLEFRDADELLYALKSDEGSELIFKDQLRIKSEKTLEELFQVLDAKKFVKRNDMILNNLELQTQSKGGEIKFKNGVELMR